MIPPKVRIVGVVLVKWSTIYETGIEPELHVEGDVYRRLGLTTQR